MMEYHLSVNVLGIIASGSYISYMLATITVPLISSKVGFRFPVILGGMFAMIGMLLIGAAQNVWMLTIGMV